MGKTIVAFYDDFSNVQQAVRELGAAKFPRDEISLVANDADRRYSRGMDTTDEGTDRGLKGRSGAAAGTVTGDLLGRVCKLEPGRRSLLGSNRIEAEESRPSH